MGHVADTTLFSHLLEEAKHSAISQTTDVAGLSNRLIDWIEFNAKGFRPYVVELAKRSSDSRLYFLDVKRAADDSFYRACGKYSRCVLVDRHV